MVSTWSLLLSSGFSCHHTSFHITIFIQSLDGWALLECLLYILSLSLQHHSTTSFQTWPSTKKTGYMSLARSLFTCSSMLLAHGSKVISFIQSLTGRINPRPLFSGMWSQLLPHLNFMAGTPLLKATFHLRIMLLHYWLHQPQKCLNGWQTTLHMFEIYLLNRRM